MKRFMLSLLFLPVLTQAQGTNEYAVSVRNGILLNKGRLTQYEQLQSSGVHTRVKNTLTQAISFHYTRVTRRGLLLSAGINAGYEQYAAKVNFPFKDYGFVEPATLGDHYTIRETVPFAEVQLGIGYRFANFGKFRPEIRLYQILQTPLKTSQHSVANEEQTTYGFTTQNFYSTVFAGNIDKGGFVGVLLNSLTVSSHIPSSSKVLDRCTVGLQIQHQIIPGADLNSMTLRYLDANGYTRSREEFVGKHTTISILVGVNL